MASLYVTISGNASVNLADYQSGRIHPEAIIYDPVAAIPAFVLPENNTVQASTAKDPVSTNRLFKASLSYLLNNFGSLLTASEYLSTCDRGLIRLNVSVIIFPFHYHW